MGVEVAQHYKVLGLPRRASSDEVRAAYLELAKKWHPDVNSRRNALQRFQRINDAYTALAGYDPEAEARKRQKDPPKRVKIRVPLTCSRCNAPTLQPRQASFTTVVSLLVLSWQIESAGVFCPACARAAGLKASFLSGLFGWWSLPGIFLTPLTVLRNARGGRLNAAANLNFLCHNLQAFEDAGDTEAARRLAYVIARTPSSVAVKINVSVAALIANDNRGPGQDEWKQQMDNHLRHVAAATVLPVAVLAALFV